jgi:hypothetical protein
MTPMPASRRISIVLLAGSLVAGCGVLDKKVVGSTIPAHGSLIPNKTINISPGYSTTLEKVAASAGAAAVLYYVYRPLDPNWEAADVRIGEDTFRVSLRMKRFYTGGEGEALQLARQYAENLQAAHGASEYALLSFSQGIDSSTPISRRVAEATVRLKNMKAPQPDIEGPPWPLTEPAAAG